MLDTNANKEVIVKQYFQKKAYFIIKNTYNECFF
jgi:hypothetical protein